ncbi:NlmOI [Streptomyces sp. CA-210063]|uniref:NlmOI n=1 Tax=Streptomyces sp. CA-210063 TaxID=2801029 RepID=UPI00214B16C0|nr:NlmOI [Streptomyces sp. CA-210063]UUU36197.1 NlmOI [Streptomyces sp. CA-210063]
MSAQSVPSSDEALRDSVPADSGEIVFPTRGEVAPEMAQLDFILGDFRIAYTNLTTEQVSTGEATCSARPLADGRFYEWTQNIPVPGIVATWLLGWSDVDKSFACFYYDDWGHHGTFTSPGWVDGHFTITGDSAVFGGRHRFVDDFTVIDDNHFEKKGFIVVGDELVPGDLLTFSRF